MAVNKPLIKPLALTLWRSVAIAALVLLVLAAVAISLARWFAPHVASYRGEIESWVSHYLEQPVSIGAMTVDWRGWGPDIELKDVVVTQRDGGTLQLKEARVGFDLLEIFSSGKLEPSALVVIGLRLKAERRADGSVVLEGVEGTGLAGSEGDIPIGWLLSKSRLELRKSQLHWIDHKRNDDITLTNLNLSLTNVEQRHLLKGAVELPQELGGKLGFAAELNGAADRPKQWRGVGYLQAADLAMTDWMRELLPPWFDVAGRSDLDLWGEWRDGRLVQISGEAALAGITLSGGRLQEQPSLALDSVAGRFLWQRERSGWRLDVDHFSLARDEHSWPQTGFSFRLLNGEGGYEAEGGFEWLRLDDVADIALHLPLLDENLTQGIAGLQPAGDIKDFKLNFQQNRDQPELRYRAEFEDLAVASWQGGPALSGLSGSIQGDEQSGRVALKSSASDFDLQPLFRSALHADQLEGELLWRYFPDHLHLQAERITLANADITTLNRFSIDIPFDFNHTPFLDLQTSYEGGDLSQVGPYLPVAIMPVDAVSWLDRAIVSGDATSGSVLFHGSLSAFPYDRGEGRLSVVTNISNGVLDYTEGWPRIEELEGQLRIDGRSLAVDAESGKILNNDIGETLVTIDDMLAAKLVVDGNASGDLAEMFHFLTESPMASDYRELLDDHSGRGKSQLHLGLSLPLDDRDEPISTRVALKLEGATIRSKAWQGELSAINGTVRIGNDGVQAKGVKAKLFGRDVAVDITAPEGKARQIKVTGRFAVTDLPGTAEVKPYVSGESRWHAELNMPPLDNRKRDNKQGVLRLSSSLDGLALKLPPPFEKARKGERNLSIELPINGQLRELKVDYAERASARLQLKALKQGFELLGGRLHLGAGKATTSERDFYLGGELEQFDLDRWLAFVREIVGEGEFEIPELLAAIDVRVEQFLGFGREFHNVAIQLERERREWLLMVDSTEVKGAVVIPQPFGKHDLLRVELERMRLARLEDDKQDEIPDPRKIPSLHVNCQQFSLGDIEFGEMTLRTRRRDNGLHLERLELKSEVQRLTSSGDWTLQQGQHRSKFKIELNGDDVGEILDVWGYAVNMKDGRVKARIDAAWNGSPSQFSLQRMEGSLWLKIFDGRLLDIEPGVGRVFGLLGVHTLPRWLTLDFGDLFKKGFSYDNIKGKFILKDGIAQTRDLRMDGSSALIEIKGRVGLIEESYDQRVTVTPKLTSSLPIAGAIAGGPVAGAALWVADKIFGNKVNEMSQSRYTVVGSWDEPEITKIETGKGAPVEER
ncbi:YhdP family protein [Candidatus Reidiella endopervernicosa]|uniref:TIGR02099 family protein n=1 Tax=Candidatus Reidiella endopervernicosa TaxID=2738883 RepID=A0A6N0HUT5_9GAMM|nr:YhdP family protein [Candidatus Reidiella endopervernicosa]QKQ26143.1 TIGR02099 family protein [Candidatus Reidiella endopervernicosa]